jgi:hypothetical protein
MTDTSVTSIIAAYRNELLLNHMFQQRHTGVLNSAPMVFQISCFLYSRLVNMTLPYSFWSIWGWFQAVSCGSQRYVTTFLALHSNYITFRYIRLGYVWLRYVSFGLVRLRFLTLRSVLLSFPLFRLRNIYILLYSLVSEYMIHGMYNTKQV